MFATYTVLFVGYSHNDPVMHYLARGLPPTNSTSRFALTSAENLERWNFLGVTPIRYPLTDEPNQHRMLRGAIAAWVELAKMGALDHEQRIRGIVQSPPPLDRETADYLDTVLGDVSTAQYFTRYAKTPAWLRWAESQPAFQALFKPEAEPNDLMHELAQWFATNFVCEYAGEALAVIQRQGQRLHAVLWDTIALELFRRETRPDPQTLATWVAVLLRSPPRVAYRHNTLNYVLTKCRGPEDDVAALLLFDYLTKPRLDLKQSFRLRHGDGEQHAQADFELGFEGDLHFLKETWASLFRPHLAIFAERLEHILGSHLHQAYLLLRAVGSANNHLDLLSYRRSAIEPHEQDRYGKGPDVLIDAARDVIEWMLTNRPERARAIIEAWGSSDIPILQRLAIHGVTASQTLSPDEKLAWLQARGWLYTFGLKHEVFRLLQQAYPRASPSSCQALLEQVHHGPEGDEVHNLSEETRQYAIYNLLVWLHQIAPGCPFAAAALEAMRQAHPDFPPPERPDFHRWVTSGWVEPRSPLGVEELLA
ncbi:MAG: hypothetical protein ACREOH_06650, partial [Candidatus Entotheonellia bacterium]